MKIVSEKERLKHVKNYFLFLRHGRWVRGYKKKFKGRIPRRFASRVEVRIQEIIRFGHLDDRESLLRTVNYLYEILNEGGSVRLNFDKTRELHPDATLYFKAHLNRLLDKYPNRITSTYPKNDIVGQLFQHVGLLARFGLADKFKISAQNVIEWQSLQGYQAEGEKIATLLQAYNIDVESEFSKKLYGAMVEALTNCNNHAYPCHSNNEDKSWYIFSKFNDKGELTIAYYDCGVGIPNSLRAKPVVSDYLMLRNSHPRKSDKRMIGLAVGSNRSSTKLPFRGKGLPEMLEFIRSTEIGGLYIQSYHGCYIYNSASKLETRRDYRNPIVGTLIQWTVPLTSGVKYESTHDLNC